MENINVGKCKVYGCHEIDKNVQIKMKKDFV